jgi:toxin ParE1/3/4
MQAGEAAANRFLAALQSTFDPLRTFPLAGRARDDFAPGLRVALQSGYAIYYLPQSDALVIVRVLHGGRDARALAERGEFVKFITPPSEEG